MMKKLIPLFIVGMVVLGGLEAVATPLNMTQSEVQNWEIQPQTTVIHADELDQYQLLMDFFGPVGNGYLWGHKNYIMAQGIKPTKNLLTRVELLLGRNNTTTFDFTLHIRANLNGPDLTSLSVPAAAIPAQNFSWIEFDVANLMVTPGQSYYLVASTVNATDNWYAWGVKLTNVYPNGTVFWTTNLGANWTEEPTLDLAFKTYGTSATTLEVNISGFLGVTVRTKNIGGFNATNVNIQVTITGGLLGLINVSNGWDVAVLPPQESVVLNNLLLGLGSLNITATARADNAEEVKKSVHAILILFLVIIR